MTHDDEGGPGTRRAHARARAQRLRTHRRGTIGLALFVGGPVLGFAAVVAGILLGMTGPEWWLLAIPAGILVGIALHRIGLRMLLSAEDARQYPVSAGDAPDAAASGASAQGAPAPGTSTPPPAQGSDTSVDP